MVNPHIINTLLNNPWPSHGKLKIQIRLSLCIERVLVTRHLEIIGRFLITDNMFLQIGIASLCSLDFELYRTTSVQKA